jgi:drug/metabolite transporter (DMT)-like permease
MYPENHLHGALFAISAALMFAAMGATVKVISVDLPTEMAVFFRNFFGLMALLPWLLRGGISALATQHFNTHLLRSLAGVAAMYCFFYAIHHLPLSEAVLLNFTAPLFMPFVVLIWFKESVSRALWWAILAGFLGIILILKPGMAMFSPAALIGLASGALAALAVANIRRMTETEPTTRIVFYFCIISTLVSAIPLAWHWQMPDPALWGFLVLSGVFATAGQLLLTRSYALASASFIGPFTYSSVVFATIIGWLLWDENPHALTLAGALLVCVAGIIAMRQVSAPQQLKK